MAQAAEALGYTSMPVVSGAGHDACWAARVAPATMVMCPCVDGLSHNEAEEITPDWAEKGANVLFHAVVETAEIVDSTAGAVRVAQHRAMKQLRARIEQDGEERWR